MHIPDGFVSGTINASNFAVASAVTALALWRSRRHLAQRQVPLLGVTSAFIFAAQMLNFPVAVGVSGHFLGALLAAILMGPLNACLIMAVVLGAQCLLFADGGLTALGSNFVNMALLGGGGGYIVFRMLRALLPGGKSAFIGAAAVAAWVSVVLAAMACAAELCWSGTQFWPVALPALSGVYAVVGIGEAAITAAVLATILAVRPDLVGDWPTAAAPAPARAHWQLASVALLVTAALAAFVSPLASVSPDGLEALAERTQLHEAPASWTHAPLSEYRIHAISNETVSLALAALLGTAAVFGLALLLNRIALTPTALAAGTAAPPAAAELTHSAARPDLALDPRTRVLLTMGYVLVVVSTPADAQLAFTAYFVLLLLALGCARVDARRLFSGLTAAFPVIFGVTVFLPFLTPGRPIQLWGLPVTVEGLTLFGTVLTRTLLSLLCVLTLTTTTQFPALLRALIALKVPEVFVALLGMTQRYALVLGEEARRMQRARLSRGYSGRWLWHCRSLGRLIGVLFLRSYERGERVYLAMCARGYSGAMPASAPWHLRTIDVAVLSSAACALAAIRLVLA